jgi:hypothetical protein
MLKGISKPNITQSSFLEYLHTRRHLTLSPADAKNSLIIPNYQRDIIRAHVAQMKTSILQGTVLQDISVIPATGKSISGCKGKYEVVDGQHRALALIELGFHLPICIDYQNTNGTNIFILFNKGKPVNPNHMISLSKDNPTYEWITHISEDQSHSMYKRIWFGKGKRSKDQFKATFIYRILTTVCHRDTDKFYTFSNFVGKLISKDNDSSNYNRRTVLYGLYLFWEKTQKYPSFRFNINNPKHVNYFKKYNFTSQGINRISSDRGYAYRYFERSFTRYWNSVKPQSIKQ